ncbi:MAG TPA: GtrA family protein [Rudaea sp.]
MADRASVRQFLLFCIGGVIGFIVDAGVLQLLVTGLAWDRFSGRLISFVVAATATWQYNRHFTFRGQRAHSLFGEWLRYMFAMSGGFACNYAAYIAVVLMFNLDKAWLILAVATGSVAGLGVNYTASRYWVYRKAHAHPPEPRQDEHGG